MPFCRRSVACGAKDYGDGTRERVTAQIVGWVNVTRRTNLPLQIGTLTKRRDKAALIWSCRRVRVLALHSYPSARLTRGFLFCCRCWPAARRCAEAAVIDFRSKNEIEAPLHVIDRTGVWWQKPRSYVPDEHSC